MLSLKKKLKQWELSFLKNHGRKPTKEDVSAGSPELQDMYKKYREVMKSLALERVKEEEERVGKEVNKTTKKEPVGVFGTHLNKRNILKSQRNEDGNIRVRPRSTWCLPPLKVDLRINWKRTAQNIPPATPHPDDITSFTLSIPPTASPPDDITSFTLSIPPTASPPDDITSFTPSIPPEVTHPDDTTSFTPSIPPTAPPPDDIICSVPLTTLPPDDITSFTPSVPPTAPPPDDIICSVPLTTLPPDDITSFTPSIPPEAPHPDDTTSFTPSIPPEAPHPDGTTSFTPSITPETPYPDDTTFFTPSIPPEAPHPDDTTSFTPSIPPEAPHPDDTTSFTPSIPPEAPHPDDTTSFTPSIPPEAPHPDDTTSFTPSIPPVTGILNPLPDDITPFNPNVPPAITMLHPLPDDTTSFTSSIPPEAPLPDDTTSFTSSIPPVTPPHDDTTSFTSSAPPATPPDDDITSFTSSIPLATPLHDDITSFTSSVPPATPPHDDITSFTSSVPPATSMLNPPDDDITPRVPPVTTPPYAIMSFNPSIPHATTPPDDITSMIMAGYSKLEPVSNGYRVAGSGGDARRFRGVTTQWLDRCCPDLSVISEVSADSKHAGGSHNQMQKGHIDDDSDGDSGRNGGGERRGVIREGVIDKNGEICGSAESEGGVGGRIKVGGKVQAANGGGGTGSENFVKLNLKVKRYSRRGRLLSGAQYKRREWKQRQKEAGSGSSGRSQGGGRFGCFRCGKVGHWAKNCTDNGGSTHLGNFAGEKVEFNDSMILGEEEEKLDREAMEALEKDSPFPTVQEAAAMAAGKKVERRMVRREEDEEETSSYVPSPVGEVECCPPAVAPLLKTDAGTITTTPTFVMSALRHLGYSSFRPGQEEVVMRVLSGISTLMITATGSGKSLCYQLPAYLYREQGHGPCLTLVISPLLSLMDDQVLRLPPGLKGACLHTNKTRLHREKTMRDVAEGKVDVLMLSPEALVGGALWSRSGGGYSLKDVPPIVFACIDEVHCVSEWSHNFRPSYLRLLKTLRDRLGVQCVLGLTATATHATGLSVARQLGVAEENIVWGASLPDNLNISVSCDEDRDQALVELLSREPYKNLDSIIVYCTRQQTTETVAQILRTSFQSWNQNGNYLTQNQESMGIEIESGSVKQMPNQEFDTGTASGTRKRKKASATKNVVRKRKKVTTILADSYHAGMSSSRRKSVQNSFMRGNLRIVVATVAFGMGLDKADVRAIVHYNMPRSVESFVQEIGRAGRDGNPAYCHTFIDREGKDLSELRRHIFTNSVDIYSLKKLVQTAFPTCQCSQLSSTPTTKMADTPSSSLCHDEIKGASLERPCRHEVAISIEAMVKELDVSEECLETLICYLEMHGVLEMKGTIRDVCTLKCGGGSRQVKSLAWKVPAVGAAAFRLKEKGVDLEASSSRMTFSITDVANTMGWGSHILRSELLSLQVNDRGTSHISMGGRSSVLVELDGLAFHLMSPGSLTLGKKEDVIGWLSEKVSNQEKRDHEKLHLLHAVLRYVSMETQEQDVNRLCDAHGVSMAGSCDLSIKDSIQQYLSPEGLSTSDLRRRNITVLSGVSEVSEEEDDLIGRDVATLVSRFSDQQFTGRVIARIFHGIPSPCFSALVWGVQRGFWRRYLHVDFKTLCQITSRKLLQLRT